MQRLVSAWMAAPVVVELKCFHAKIGGLYQKSTNLIGDETRRGSVKRTQGQLKQFSLARLVAHDFSG